MSNLKVMNQQLEKARNVKEIFAIDFVRERAIKNYEGTTGRHDGENWFAGEAFHMMSLFAEKPKLAECDKMSIFAALVKAGTTGLSIKHGQIDLIPYGRILKAEPNYKGLRQQLRNMPTIKMVYEASLVMKDDDFEYDELNKKVIKHIKKGAPKTITLADINASYVRMEFTDGHIIDTIMWNFELVKAKSKSKNKGEDSTWDQFPHEMCKKSVVKRANKIYYEPPVVQVVGFTPLPDEDTEDVGHEEVDETTGEVMTPEVIAEEQPQRQQPTQPVKTDMDDFLKS